MTHSHCFRRSLILVFLTMFAVVSKQMMSNACEAEQLPDSTSEMEEAKKALESLWANRHEHRVPKFIKQAWLAVANSFPMFDELENQSEIPEENFLTTDEIEKAKDMLNSSKPIGNDLKLTDLKLLVKFIIIIQGKMFVLRREQFDVKEITSAIAAMGEKAMNALLLMSESFPLFFNIPKANENLLMPDKLTSINFEEYVQNLMNHHSTTIAVDADHPKITEMSGMDSVNSVTGELKQSNTDVAQNEKLHMIQILINEWFGESTQSDLEADFSSLRLISFVMYIIKTVTSEATPNTDKVLEACWEMLVKQYFVEQVQDFIDILRLFEEVNQIEVSDDTTMKNVPNFEIIWSTCMKWNKIYEALKDKLDVLS